jgi:hypothetical protein
MGNSKKLLIALAVIVMVAATPAFADPVYWSGVGDYVEWEESPGNFLNPWFNWHGTLSNGTFSGEWENGADAPPPLSYPFFGSIIYYYTPGDDGPTFAHCEGDWCIDYGTVLRVCGWFTMEFNMTDGTCEGTWGVNGDENIGGNMWGNGY